MKRLKYTITSYQSLPKLEDFEAKDENDLLDKIKKYIEEDPTFALDGLDEKFSIQTEIVEGIQTMRKQFRVTLIFETKEFLESVEDGPNCVVPDVEFFQEQWEQTAAAMEGDTIKIEKIEEIPDVETKKL
jgi:hypothetical protein